MASLTPGANAALSSHQLTVTLELGGVAEPAALLLAEHGGVRSASDFVSVQSVTAPGVSWGGSPDGAGWRLGVDLASVPHDVETVRIVGSLPEGEGTFGQLVAPFVRVDDASGAPQATFEAVGLGAETSVIFVELYRRQDAWKVRAVGQGYTGGRVAMLADHGVDPAALPAPAAVAPTSPAAPAVSPRSGQPSVRYERPDRTTTNGSSPATPAASSPGVSYSRPDRTTTPPPSTPAPAGGQPPAQAPAPPAQPAKPVSYARPDRALSTPAPAAPPPVAAQVAAPPPSQPARPAPAATSGPLPLWDLVEKPDPANQPVRPVQWQTQGAEFTWCEMLRNTLPDSETLPAGTDKFTVTEQWAEELRAVRGSGFEYTWRNERDERLNPNWVTLRSALVEEGTGRIVAAGHLTHQNLGSSPAYDLGAITGSNGISWAKQGHDQGIMWPTECLYIGSTRTGILAPVASSANILSVDLDPITGAIGIHENLGSTGCISVYDGATGTRRRLTVIETVSGNEPVRFSLDGKWLLLPRYDGSYLCEVATGRTVHLPLKYATWWPLADSMLLEVVEVNGKRVPRLFSLETNDYVHDFAPIDISGSVSPGVDYIAHPAVSPDGTEMLVVTPYGVGPVHKEAHGVGGHLARVSLADGRGRLVCPVTLDMPFPTERDVSEARWSARYPYRQVTLAPALTQALQPPMLEHDMLSPGHWSGEAEELLVKALNRTIAVFQEGGDVAPLMPEIVMSMITMGEDRAVWAHQHEWLSGLVSTVADMMSDGRIPEGRASAAWLNFAITAAMVSQDVKPPVSSVEVAWIPK